MQRSRRRSAHRRDQPGRGTPGRSRRDDDRPPARHPLALAAVAGAACLVVAAVATAGSPVAYTAYVGNFGSGSLTPINTATNAASSTTSINDPSAIAITPNGTTALVANWSRGDRHAGHAIDDDRGHADHGG